MAETHHQPLTRWARETGGHRPGHFPVTDDVAARALALPMISCGDRTPRATAGSSEMGAKSC